MVNFDLDKSEFDFYSQMLSAVIQENPALEYCDIEDPINKNFSILQVLTKKTLQDSQSQIYYQEIDLRKIAKATDFQIKRLRDAANVKDFLDAFDWLDL